MVEKLNFYYKIDINEILFKNNNGELKLTKGENIFIKENHYPLNFKVFAKVFLKYILSEIKDDIDLYLNYKDLDFRVLRIGSGNFVRNANNNKKLYDILPLDIKNSFLKLLIISSIVKMEKTKEKNGKQFY